MRSKSLMPLVLAFIILLLVGIYAAKGNIVLNNAGGTMYPAATGPYVRFPSNKTYDSGLQTLHLDFHYSIIGNVNFSASYSLDGKENETVPLEDHYFGFFQQRGHPDRNYWDGSVALPTLSNGSHCLTVYLECTWETGDSAGSHFNKSFDSETVHFAVLSPIALLREKNQTYNTTEIPLDYHINGTTSQIAYS